MTSEVVLMNRSAVALAADSAVTVSHWHRTGKETRFYKGANKIFNLAYGHPVALMTYSSATMLGVPLEVIVKAYREQLKQGFKDLEGYATGFLHYLPSELRLFPKAHQEAHFMAQAERVAYSMINPISQVDDVKNAQNEQAKKQAVDNAWGIITKAVDDAPLIGNATKKDVEDASAKYGSKLAEALANDQYFVSKNPGLNAKDVAELAIKGLYKKPTTVLDKTGFVVVGYGEDEFFPTCIVYDCWGIVNGAIIYEVVNRKSVSHTDTSHVIPLAQSQMINTFVHGISPDVLGEIGSILQSVMHEFEKEACGDNGHREELRDKAGEQFVDRVLKELFEKHTLKLRRAVGSLPIGELAELAETLISLESLKERVTRTSDSVSGPVDVAVISKGDGFIWIARKHYFDLELNPRFLATTVRTAGGPDVKKPRAKAGGNKRATRA